MKLVLFFLVAFPVLLLAFAAQERRFQYDAFLKTAEYDELIHYCHAFLEKAIVSPDSFAEKRIFLKNFGVVS